MHDVAAVATCITNTNEKMFHQKKSKWRLHYLQKPLSLRHQPTMLNS